MESPASHPTESLLTKLDGAPAKKKAMRSGDVASHLLLQATRRLEIVSISLLFAVLVLWLGTNAFRGTLPSELAHLYQWGPPVGVFGASLVMLALGRTARLSPAAIVRIGLVFEVVVGFGVVAGSLLGAFGGMRAEEIIGDRVGINGVAVWMLFFTIMVPARPREALVALLATASAVPILYATQVASGQAPALSAGTFFLVLVLPYLTTVAFAYVAARVVHGLGVEVRRAQEMGSYRLDALLGKGGMGEVWRASHHTLARPAAIKLIRRDALGPDAESAAMAAVRFEREAQVIASLRSPHTVALYDYGSNADGTLYYVMELLDGVDLERLVRRYGPLPVERVVRILSQVCSSLSEAHRRGLVHRDVKPANIYLCREVFDHDVAKLLDFGLVRQLAPIAGLASVLHSRADVVAGTPAYMAPEMVLGRAAVDGRADLYSLGCVGFWLLTGRLLFEAETPTEMIVAHVKEPPPSPSSRAKTPVPAALDQLILDCLAKDPAARPQTATEVRARLAQVPSPAPWTSERAEAWWASHEVGAGSGDPEKAPV